MNLKDKIFIAGHKGLVGSAILRKLQEKGFTNLLTYDHKELDLINQASVNSFFEREKPSYVILAAAKVGGIYANNNFPADFIYQNLMIEANVIHAAYENKVKRLIFLGSTCIYPKNAQQPIQESALLTDLLEPTNEPYAIAKISGIKLCESYNRQYGMDFRSIMPTNLYGINDNFHPTESHVIPALIGRFHEAKVNDKTEVAVWGTGKPIREFLYVDDMADATLFILGIDKRRYQSFVEPMISHINVGSGVETSIANLAETIKKVVGFKGKIVFDRNKLDGAPKKISDVSRLKKIGWKYSVELSEGLKKTYAWYLLNKD